MNNYVRRSAGVAERNGLENRCGGDSTQGSNPCSSAIFFYLAAILVIEKTVYVETFFFVF